MANFQVPVGYQFPLSVTPEDIEGNPVPDTLTWTTSDTVNTSVTVDDATTLKVTVKCTGLATGVAVTATDANSVTSVFDVDVVPDVPTTLVFTPGTPVKIPAA